MEDPSGVELATPTLMRAARGAYAGAIRAELHAIGIDDMPRNGTFVLAGLDTRVGPRRDLPSGLGVTKQAVSQVVDTLVTRGYLERSPDPADRRRIVLELTARGREAVDAAVRAVDEIDRQLRERVSPAQIDAMRTALLALGDIKSRAVSSGTARPPPRRELQRVSPVLPVRDLAAALVHYSALGFQTFAPGGADEYGFARRDGVELHLAARRDHDAAHNDTSAYLSVRDADALYHEWSRPGLAGHTHPVGPTSYKLREGSHVDPDGNLIRFGSPMDTSTQE